MPPFLSLYRVPGRLPRFKEDMGVHRHSAIAMVEDHERIYFNRGDFGKVLYERLEPQAHFPQRIQGLLACSTVNP